MNRIGMNNARSLATQRMFSKANAQQAAAGQKIGSAKRINKAADDAAGLLQSEEVRSQLRGLMEASKNSQTAVSLTQTADGALSDVGSQLTRMRELTVQAANLTDQTALGAIQAEIDGIAEGISGTAGSTSFNGTNLLDGSTPSLTVQTGANGAETTQLSMVDARASALGDGTTSIADLTSAGGATAAGSQASATSALGVIDAAISQVSGGRASIGAQQNRLESTISNLSQRTEDLTAAESRIRDADMAAESTNLMRAQILARAGGSMMAQGNANAGALLGLLS